MYLVSSERSRLLRSSFCMGWPIWLSPLICEESIRVNSVLSDTAPSHGLEHCFCCPYFSSRFTRYPPGRTTFLRTLWLCCCSRALRICNGSNGVTLAHSVVAP